MKEKLSDRMLPPPTVTVTEEYVVIENTDGICTFSDCEIAVRRKGGMIIVTGEGLIISRLEEERLVLGGKIVTVTFA